MHVFKFSARRSKVNTNVTIAKILVLNEIPKLPHQIQIHIIDMKT
jgi:hypothetical protein